MLRPFPQVALLLWWILCLAPAGLGGQGIELVTQWPTVSAGGFTMAQVDSRGLLYLAGTSTASSFVSIHDLQSGRERGRLGRACEGPGEYRHIMGLAVHADSLAILDVRHGRISVYTPEHDLARTVRVPEVFAVGPGLGWSDRGFVFMGLRLSDPPPRVGRLFILEGDRQVAPVSTYTGSAAGSQGNSFMLARDSLLVLRHQKLGAWLVGPRGEGSVIVSDTTYSVQVHRSLPYYISASDGAIAGWLEHGRLVTIHHRYPADAVFPEVPIGTRPPPLDIELVSVLRVVDRLTGELETERELPIPVKGAFAPGLLWGYALEGLEVQFYVWRLSDYLEDGE